MEVFDATSARAVWPVQQAPHAQPTTGQGPAVTSEASGRATHSADRANGERGASAAPAAGHDSWDVQIDHDEPTNQIWINIVDQATGQVIMKIPPEALREAQLQLRVSGSVTNLRA